MTLKVPFHLPWVGEDEKREVLEALDSGWLTAGPKVKAFEAAFAEVTGARHAVAVSSCTAALHLALLGAGVGPGDEVLTTPLTFCATVNTILETGARPVLVDVDPRTLCMDPEAAERALTPRTRALLPVHYAGYPAPLGAFRELAERHGLALIDDAAHALGTFVRGVPVGRGTLATCFSFYATKNLATGDGGMVTTEDDELAAKMRKLALHGMSRDAWKRFSADGSWRYDVELLGYKYNLTDPAAGLGLAQLRRFEDMQARRRMLAATYDARMADLGLIPPPRPDDPGDVHAWHLYVVRLEPGAWPQGRDQLIEELKVRGIGTSVHYIPIHHHSYYQAELGVRPGDFPHTDLAYVTMLSLPLYPRMTDDDQASVIEALVACRR
ncbi:MAG: DegT/DnrJ/EryC1/StrS aminotransferase family protein [Candidatus Sericytochromatia bacterium]|nr:DegT/DnrJ/EryC1/StrS aminotransferase family protein [Candidatus Sericytochromatia bacterium]